jgi:hypothetical protein
MTYWYILLLSSGRGGSVSMGSISVPTPSCYSKAKMDVFGGSSTSLWIELEQLVFDPGAQLFAGLTAESLEIEHTDLLLILSD